MHGFMQFLTLRLAPCANVRKARCRSVLPRRPLLGSAFDAATPKAPRKTLQIWAAWWVLIIDAEVTPCSLVGCLCAGVRPGGNNDLKYIIATSHARLRARLLTSCL